MPRKIVSQDPITRASETEKSFDDMKMTMFRATYSRGKTRLLVNMDAYDHDSGEVLPGHSEDLQFKNLEETIQTSPKFAAAWDTINDVMGLAYDFYRLRDKVNEGMAAGDDVTELIAARNAALAALRAPV